LVANNDILAQSKFGVGIVQQVLKEDESPNRVHEENVSQAQSLKTTFE